MTLRLSSSSSTAAVTPPSMYLNQVVESTSLTLEQKTTCLKYLGIILKNLADPIKSQDLKYRTLKLDNAKLQSGLFSIPIMMDLLTKVFGFCSDNTNDNDSNTNNIMTVSLERLNQGLCQQTCIEIQHLMDTKLVQPKTTSTTSTMEEETTDTITNLSEKQKARRLLEQQQLMEKQRQKQERKRNLAMLQQDKLVRETDPNWKPGVSAACAKSGTGISTFRDRHGE